MAELVDALVSGTSGGNPVGVRVSLSAQQKIPRESEALNVIFFGL
jgi:hypothetical protein